MQRRVPVRGELVSGPGPFEIEVLDADPRRVKKMRINRSKDRRIDRSRDTKNTADRAAVAAPDKPAASEPERSSSEPTPAEGSQRP